MDRRDSIWQIFGRYSGLALLLPCSAFVGYAIGYLIDKQFGTHFWYLVLLLLGIAGGLIELLRELNKDRGS